jgi:hypothetical protein
MLSSASSASRTLPQHPSDGADERDLGTIDNPRPTERSMAGLWLAVPMFGTAACTATF